MARLAEITACERRFDGGRHVRETALSRDSRVAAREGVEQTGLPASAGAVSPTGAAETPASIASPAQFLFHPASPDVG